MTNIKNNLPEFILDAIKDVTINFEMTEEQMNNTEFQTFWAKYVLSIFSGENIADLKDEDVENLRVVAFK